MDTLILSHPVAQCNITCVQELNLLFIIAETLLKDAQCFGNSVCVMLDDDLEWANSASQIDFLKRKYKRIFRPRFEKKESVSCRVAVRRKP